MNEPVGHLLKAVCFAAQKHRDQRRKDLAQTPYINHPIAVAKTLWAHGITDIDTLVAAILHDILEDTDTHPNDLSSEFGPHILALVQEVSDDKQQPKQTRKNLQIENASTLSHAARLIRLCDKICNLQDLIHSPPANWSVERCQQYVTWCKAVIANIRNTHETLETQFDTLCGQAQKLFEKP